MQSEEKSSAVDLGKNKKKYIRKKVYYCELCAYETKNISNYKKHIKSKKHIKNENLKEKNENGKNFKSSKKMGKKVAQILIYLNVNFVQKLVLVKQVIIDIIQYVTKIRLIKEKKMNY